MAANEVYGSRWLARCRSALDPFSGVQLVRVLRSSGIHLVLSGLRSQRAQMLWIQLDERDAQDSVSVSNKLSDAIDSVFGASLFGHGVPVSHGISRLLRFHDLLGPFCVAISNAHLNLDAVHQISALGQQGSNVILVTPPDASIGADKMTVSRILDQVDFAITLDEARELAREQVPSDVVERVWGESAGHFLEFASRVRSIMGDPPIIEPEPAGFSVLGNEISDVPVELIVGSLRRRGSMVDAFEVAARLKPDLCGELIGDAGPQFAIGGLHERLFGILSALPVELLEGSESLMRWYFASATSVGAHKSVRARIERYLQDHEAPELRALYASAFPDSQLIVDTKRAVCAKETPLTLRMYGFALGQTEHGNAGLDYLRRALRLAEAFGDADEVVACATDICNFHIRRGGYREAHEWAQWALNQYLANSCKDELRRLVATGLLAFTRLLTDQLVGLDALIEELRSADRLHGLPTTETLHSTVGDWHLLGGRLEASVDAYRHNVEGMPRSQMPFFAPDLISPLLRLGRVDEALALGQRVRAMTAQSEVVSEALGRLSLGLARSKTAADEARMELSEAVALLEGNLEAQRLAQACVVLAGVCLRMGDVDAALAALDRGSVGIEQLGFSGWLLVGGALEPEEVRSLWRIFHRIEQDLEVEFLGGVSATFRSRRISLSGRFSECVAVLANAPSGISGDRLGLALYGESAIGGTLKSLVSRLRETIPVESRPYRLGVSFRADFLDLLEHLKRGRVRQALNLYKGPLLPESEAPAIVELREHIDESLRQAVLASGDAEAMIELVNRTDAGDLELLETALEHLPPNDPQSPLLRARIRQVRRDWESGERGAAGPIGLERKPRSDER